MGRSYQGTDLYSSSLKKLQPAGTIRGSNHRYRSNYAIIRTIQILAIKDLPRADPKNKKPIRMVWPTIDIVANPLRTICILDLSTESRKRHFWLWWRRQDTVYVHTSSTLDKADMSLDWLFAVRCQATIDPGHVMVSDLHTSRVALYWNYARRHLYRLSNDLQCYVGRHVSVLTETRFCLDRMYESCSSRCTFEGTSKLWIFVESCSPFRQ